LCSEKKRKNKTICLSFSRCQKIKDEMLWKINKKTSTASNELFKL